MPMEQEIGCWDSVLLENLTEENFINNLQQRFKRDNIYTYIGTYLVSLNPYKPIAIYSSDLIEKYGRKSLFQLPPHIYAISNLAYQGLQDYNEDQCIILSGESGSGKTESSRIIIHFLTEVSEIKTRFKTTPNKYKKIISNGSNPEIYPILSKRNTTTGCIKFDAGSGNSVKKCSREKSVDFDFSHHKSVENLSSKCSSHPLTLNSKISKSIEGNDSLVNLNKKCSKHCGSGVANKTTEFQNKLFNNYNDTNCIEICPKSYKINKNILKDSDELAQSTCNRVNSIKTITPDEQQQFSQKSNIIASKQCCQKDMCTLPSKFKLSSSSSSSINKTNKNTFLSDPHAGGSSNIKVLKLTNSSHNCEIDANKMRERVAQAEIFLEAMGNAETQKNSNSSRFGRFFDIEFDFKGDPLSGHITYYMLEKSRVTRTNHNERNFHIFYQLLSGADIHLLKTLKLQRNIDKYELLKYGAVNDEDKFKFPFTFNSLEQLGLFPDEISSIFKIIAVVLKLGNLVFMSTTNIDGTEGTDISNDYELHEISQLLGLDEQLLFNCLTKSGVNWNHLDNGAELDAKNASSYRFILCRTLYGRLFTWIVNRINESLKFKQYKRGKNLGILDFYGFEILENNSYEQLVINYCNERFQQHFVQFVLKYQQDLYNREGLDWIKIDYFDNLSICELIDRPNHGIMSLLDEPQVTCDGTFSTRLNQCCSGHTSFLIQDSNIKNSSFQIRHYAGPVTYSTIGFIEKNLDNLPKHISSCLYQCRLSIVQNLFPEGNPKKSTKKPSTLSSSLRTSLQTLLSLIENRKSHYVFCMKPNERKQQKVFELALIQHQVRYLSLLPLAQLWRSGHYFNMSHNKFLNRYKLLSNLTWPHYNKDNVVESIAFVIRSIPLPAAEFTIGRKHVFIRSPRTVHELEEFRKSRLDYLAILIQKTFRRYYLRKHFLRMKKSQILIASAWKMWRECRFGISFRGKKHLWGLYRVAREEYRLIKYRKQVEWAVGVLQRHHIQWQKKQFLLTLMLRLPTNCNSPLCMDWPTAPRFLAETSQLLMNIHHRWRCHMYRKKFDQTSRNRMREKVTASIIFKDRKSSYARSVSHPFIGDYVRLRQNVQWKKICVENNDQYVVFADIINKITRSSGKFVPILLVLSTSSMLLLDQRTLQIKYRVPAAEIYRMSLSPYLDDIAVFHIKADNNYFPNQLCETDSATGCLFQSEYGKKKGDFVFQTGHVIEIVTKLFLVIQNATSKPPEVHISTEFEANFGQQTVVFTFKCGGLAELAHGQARVARKGNRMEVIV